MIFEALPLSRGLARLLLQPVVVKGVSSQIVPRAADRNYPALVMALEEVLGALDDGDTDEDALRRSFENSANGFGAEKALLLVVEGCEPLRLRAIASRGLSVEEIAACEQGRSVPGVSSSRIREAVARRVPIMVQDSERLVGPDTTEALRGKPASVLCAPICERRSGQVLAILYVQNHGVACAFGEVDLAWVSVYALALGRVLSAARPQPLAGAIP